VSRAISLCLTPWGRTPAPGSPPTAPCELLSSLPPVLPPFHTQGTPAPLTSRRVQHAPCANRQLLSVEEDESESPTPLGRAPLVGHTGLTAPTLGSAAPLPSAGRQSFTPSSLSATRGRGEKVSPSKPSPPPGRSRGVPGGSRGAASPRAQPPSCPCSSHGSHQATEAARTEPRRPASPLGSRAADPQAIGQMPSVHAAARRGGAVKS